MGEFNLPNIGWTVEKQTPAPGNKLKQLVAENNLAQHVRETTRYRIIYWTKSYFGRRSNCKHENKRQNWRPWCNSIFNIERKVNTIGKNNYNFRKENFDAMRNELDHQTFEELIIRNNAEFGFEMFKSRVNDIRRRHIPKRRVTINDPSWSNNFVKLVIGRKQRAYEAKKNETIMKKPFQNTRWSPQR